MFEELNNILTSRNRNLQIFFRNDDGGWADKELDQLCEWFTKQNLTLDIACIPTALDSDSVAMLTHWLDLPDSIIRLHQHGYSHQNHQTEGRACEFGDQRTFEQQRMDIKKGKQLLSDVLGENMEPVFTPPWNRCTDATIKALQAEGFQYLSRITGSTELKTVRPLTTQNVAIDWLKKKNGARLEGKQFIEYITRQFDTKDRALGVMLHHEHMGSAEMRLLHELIETLRDSPNVSFGSLVEAATPEGRD